MIAMCFVVSAAAPERRVSGVVSHFESGSVLAGVKVSVKGTSVSTTTDSRGKYSLLIPPAGKVLTFYSPGFETLEVGIGPGAMLDVQLKSAAHAERLVHGESLMIGAAGKRTAMMPAPYMDAGYNTEAYDPVNENGFQLASRQPLTTFAADVDRASYSNVRRFINSGQLPPADAVRIEEMINYFDYSYPQPDHRHPVSVSAEITDSPWNKGLRLVHIGVQARKLPLLSLPPSNLVFLIDVSGSMMAENKLPLIVRAFRLLVDQLRAEDRVSIVVYAGAAGVVLPPTPGDQKVKMKDALEKLRAGGATAGAGGIGLAYKIAQESFIRHGNNRVILATDGDFNVGISSKGGLQQLVEEKRKSGIYLSVLGVGTGNYKDAYAETLADKGNGNYAYIDNIREARKVFVNEFGGTLFTVAGDVKLQVEFNPGYVGAYRLIGYENRALKNEDFNDDSKDAGEMGAGHSVTAIYEIIPASAYLPTVDALRYSGGGQSDGVPSDEMLTVKVRYKEPGREQSRLMETPVANKPVGLSSCPENFRFAMAVAEFGLLLRNSPYKGSASYDGVIRRAGAAKGADDEGYRSEFIGLVKMAAALDAGRDVAVTEK